MHILSHENSVRFCGQKRGVCCCDFAAAAKLHFFRCLDTKNARKITESKSSDFAEHKWVSISKLAKQKFVRVKLYRKPDRSDEPNPFRSPIPP